MTLEESYREAERRIEVARQEGATELDLSNLALTEVPEAIGQLTQLEKLILGGWREEFKNQLTGLPDAITNLTQLQSLDLSYNQLTELPNEIANLTQLHYLILCDNYLAELPNEITILTNLQELDLTGNRLTALPKCFGELIQLQILYLSDNRLTELPASISQLSNLKILGLTRNRLTSCPEPLIQLCNIQELGLSENNFKSLPNWLSRLSQLRKLGLANTRLLEVPEWIGSLAELRDLYLGEEEGSIGRWGFSTTRSSNRLISLPNSLCQLTKLETLNLEGNLIPDLPTEFYKFEHLISINLDGNPLNSDLDAAYKQGIASVMQYLKARAVGEISLNEAKLILVGEGEVGKSCLLGALREDAWVDSRPTTHGIEIKPVLLNASDNSAEITLNGWDFGGQRVYRPTHQLFFSATAVYLVVWKPREGPQQGFVKEWITLIKHREPDARVLIVATHGGPGQRQPDIDRQELIDLFSEETVLGFHYVDSKTGKGIDKLRETIGKVAANLPGMGRLVPTKWQEVRKLLEETGNTHMRYDDVIAICEEQGLEGFAAELFVRVSHTLGYLIHYYYDPILKDIVILKPDWLAKAISFVLDDEETRKNNGLVKFERLSHLWSHPPFAGEIGYPKELHPIFLKLMERFDLSYKVVLDPASPGASDTSLIAQLVSDNRPNKLPDWEEQPKEGDREQVQICRIVDEQGQLANAEGLFYQLIVRLHKYSLGRNNYKNSVHWQRGLMLDNDYNGRAFLEHIGTNIKITVRAAYPEFFLYELTKDVKWLVEMFWEGLRCEVMVPCIEPCGKEKPGTGLFEVQKLIESKRQGMPKFPCIISGCNQWLDIDELMRNAPVSRKAPAEKILAGELESVKERLDSIHSEIRVLGNQEQQRFQQLNENDRRILSQADEQFAIFIQMLTDEAKDGPRLFSFKPLDPGFFDRPKWVSEKFQLTLWCEHARKPLPILNNGNQQGVYELELNREWFTKAVPYFKLLTGTLSLVLPVAASTTQFMLDDATYKGIQEELDLGQKSLEFGIKSSDIAADWQTKRDSAEFQEGDAISAQGAMLRELHGFLKEKDPSFGGLVQVQNKRREFLWVHPQFVDEY